MAGGSNLLTNIAANPTMTLNTHVHRSGWGRSETTPPLSHVVAVQLGRAPVPRTGQPPTDDL